MPVLRQDSPAGGFPVTTLTLDRPPVNVLDLDLCRELGRCLDDLHREDRSRIVILRGAGRCFSTGVEIRQHDAETMPTLLPAFHDLFDRLHALRALTVAAVHGFCLGGAAELALACDRVLAESSARIGFPEVRVGCYPPVAVPLLASRLGTGRATELIVGGAEIAIDRLESWGLVHRSGPTGELDALVAAELEACAGRSPAVLGLIAEQLHHEARRLWGQEIRRLETAYLRDILPHPDAREGIAAFLEKRPPVWSTR